MTRFLGCFFCGFVVLGISACGGGGGGSSSSDACGPIRILDGDVCEVPSSAVVRLNNGRSLCTGTFITSNRVLTAGHCVENAFRGLEIIAATGARYYVPPDQLRFISAWRSTRDPAFDVAIAAVDPAFTAQNGIQPIPVSSDIDVDSLLGDDVVVAGLGQLGDGVNNSSPFPRSTFMEVTSLGNGTFTAADTGEGTGNTCVGDSGAPALYRDVNGDFAVIGVVSGGAFSNDCNRDPFTVFPFVGNRVVADFLEAFGISLI